MLCSAEYGYLKPSYSEDKIVRRIEIDWLSLHAGACLLFTMRRSKATALSSAFLLPLVHPKDSLLTKLIVRNTMSALFTTIIECITGVSQENGPGLDEKQALAPNQTTRPLDEVASDVVNTILTAEKAGARLKAELDSIVGCYGWKEYLAEKVLEKLGAALQGAHDKLGPAIRDAYNKAWIAANEIEGFVIQHPVMCTIIALGVLVVIAPWVIEVLGFAELGPLEGAYTERSMCWIVGLTPCNTDNVGIHRLFCGLVAVDLRRVGAQGILIFLFSTLGHGVDKALTNSRHGPRLWAADTSSYDVW